VLTGAKALLIRGGAGSGKSRLALALIQEGALPFARLIGDDRVRVDAQAGRLLVRPAEELAGLLEIRGLGIRQAPFEPLAVIGWIADLGAPADRLPEPGSQTALISGVALPRIAVPAGTDPLPLVLAMLLQPRSGI
jgi:HPr kinase/phosphorylase